MTFFVSKKFLLNNHDRYGGLSSQIGVVERAWVEDGKGGATIRLSRRPDVQGIVQDVRDGIVKNVSIGYEVRRVRREEQEDDKRPIYRAVDWEPFEISLVPVPADPTAQIRTQKDAVQEIEIEEQEQERELENDTTDSTENLEEVNKAFAAIDVARIDNNFLILKK